MSNHKTQGSFFESAIFPLYGDFSSIFDQPVLSLRDVVKNINSWYGIDAISEDIRTMRSAIENEDAYKSLTPDQKIDLTYTLRQYLEVFAALLHYYHQEEKEKE